MPIGIYKRTKPASKETKLKMRNAQLGKKLSDEHKLKIGIGNFKDNAVYSSMHTWISRHWGTPNKCENCGDTKRRKQWANISETYQRIRSDWKRLCVPCHRIQDRKTPDICIVEDCGRVHWVRGFCKKHYSQWYNRKYKRYLVYAANKRELKN